MNVAFYEGRPESKDCLRVALAQVIHHIVQTWPQVIFTCSQHWRNFWVAHTSKVMKKCRMASSSG